MKKERNKEPIQPVSGTKVPRYAGPSTFAILPELVLYFFLFSFFKKLR